MPVWASLLVLVVCALPLGVLLTDSLFRLLYLWLAVHDASLQRLSVPFTSVVCGNIAVAIPAHDEAQSIQSTLDHLTQLVPASSIFVIADNCVDATATIARMSGAQVWERASDDLQGKGYALHWFLKSAREVLEPYPYVVVLDADSRVNVNFFERLLPVLAGGADAAQAFGRSPQQDTPIALLADLSEFLSHRVDDMARRRLGWSVPLRGRGMAFRRPVLQAMTAGLETKVEDVELTLLLLGSGKRIHFVPEAVVSDAKPAHVSGAMRQRARWLQGQRQVWRRYGRLIGSLLFSGRPDAVAVIFASLLKPKTLLLVAKGLLLLLGIALPLHPPAVKALIAIPAGLALLIDVAYYLVGLRWVHGRRRYVKALLAAPLYLLVWAWGLLTSFVSGNVWLRSTPPD